MFKTPEPLRQIINETNFYLVKALCSGLKFCILNQSHVLRVLLCVESFLEI